MAATRRLPAALLVLVCVAAVFAGEPAKRESVADQLPEGTILVVQCARWSDWARDFSKTSVARIASEREVQDFLAGPLNRIAALFAQTRGKAPRPPAAEPQPAAGQQSSIARTAGALFDVLGSVARGPFTVAVRYSNADAQAKKLPAVAMLFGVNDPENVEAKKDVLADILEKLLQEFKIEALTVSEYQKSKLLSLVITVDGQKRNIATVALFKGKLLVSNDLEMCQQAMDGLAGTLARRLSDAEGYKSCGLTGDEHALAYMDVAGLQRALGAAEKPAADKQLSDFFTLAGLNKTAAVAWSLKMDGPAFESRTAIFTKDARAGALGAIADEPLSPAALKVCPQGTPFAAGFRLKQSEVLPFLHTMVKAVFGDKGLENFGAVEKQLSADRKADFAQEFTAACGNEVIITSLAGLENAGPVGGVSAIAASLSIQDAKKGEELLEQLLKRVAEKTDAGGVAANVYKEIEYEGVKVRYLTAPGAAGLVTPSFAIQSGRLVLALDVPTLKRALKIMKDGPSLGDTEAFKKALAETGGKMGPAFTYVDWAQIYRAVFSVGASTLKLIAPTDLLNKAGIDVNLLPSSETVCKHLFPGLSVAQITPNGVVLISRSPLPSMEVIAPPMTAVAAVFASFRPFTMPEQPKK